MLVQKNPPQLTVIETVINHVKNRTRYVRRSSKVLLKNFSLPPAAVLLSEELCGEDEDEEEA